MAQMLGLVSEYYGNKLRGGRNIFPLTGALTKMLIWEL